MPKHLNEVVVEIFPDLADIDANRAAELLVALVNLAVKARPREADQPLLPARYHVFIRAIEGAYFSLAPKKELFLARHKQIKSNSQRYQVAELAICRGCGVSYLVGEIQTREDGDYFVQPSAVRPNLKYLLLADNKLIEELDEDEEIAGQIDVSQPASLERYRLCAGCGKLVRHNALTLECECKQPFFREAYLIPSKDSKVTICRVCGRFSPQGMV